MEKKENWNKKVEHPIQAWEWGEFRNKTGVKVVRSEGMQITIHQIPYTNWNIGYYPKGVLPLDQKLSSCLKKIGNEYNCLMIKCEPKLENNNFVDKLELKKLGFVPGRSLFTKYNFVLDVSLAEEELLSNMKQKTRYNIRVAQKKGVEVTLDNSQNAFERYLELTQETTRRQGFFAHSEEYHRILWSCLKHDVKISKLTKELSSHLLTAKYQNEIITTWMLFKFGDTLYYPYGASSRNHREVMANNLVMWEAIKLAKQWGCKYFDMWGALGENPDKNDPWFGFHNFKAGYGARHVKYIGSYDFVIKPGLYLLYRWVEKIRWKMLKLKAKLKK